MGSKIAYFFSSATIAGAFSGLLAAAIHNMNGVGDLSGWRWIFIIEGLLTIVIAVFSYWVIQDFPETAKFISEEERVFVIRRLQEDMRMSAAGEKYNKKYIWQSLSDWKTWVAMGIYMGLCGGPTLRFAATAANLLSVPPYAWGCIMTVVIGLLGDHMKNRRSYVSFVLKLGPGDCLEQVSWNGTPPKNKSHLHGNPGLVGYIILICSRTPGLSYFAVFLGAS
ncbi:hypothetical protein VKT23_003267 [Stygiomarasmius scandens]|uniref:Uncharacterized protein n=1 Tax=Marasmiellus scandens TaxID=2682957 RepID=A0ABR1JWP0_9AGAR